MNKFIKYATSVAGLATLVACSGGTCAPNDNPVGDLTLAIAAPSQYPAGLPVPIQAQLTMTNTSKVNASNLVYTVPAIGESGNYTGVTITPDAGIGSASGACTNIAAGASCTFIATIGAYAKPGSFIVTATPNGTASSNTKTTNSTKSLQAGSISVTANLGLVDVPNTQNQYYILPSDQTITANSNESSVVMVSVWVKQASEGLSSLRLVDEAGAALTYVTVGTPSYAINSVNTYRVTIPAGKTLQHIQVLSNVCETLNNGDNNYTACSNDADVNLATQGHGILSVQPTQFNLSESYESQVITLTNIGTGNVGSITYPTFSSPFSVVTNNCSSVTTLTPGQSCTMTVKYTAGSTAGQITPVFGYDDDNDAATEPKNTAIIIGYAAAIVPDPGPGPGPAPVTPFSILSVTPTSASLTAKNSRKVFTITNTPGGSTAGVTIASGWTLPTLSAPLQMESTNCYASSGSVGLGAPVPMVTKALAVGASCTYTIRYLSSASAGSASPAFTYNNGIAAGQVTNVAVDWVTKFWTLITGGVGQPKFIRDVFGSPTPQSIVVSADNAPDDYDMYLWSYTNGVWKQLCNGQNGTPGAGQVLFNTLPTPNEILWSTNSGELWGYKNGAWSKILDAASSGSVPAGSSFGGVVGNSNTSFIVGTTASYQLWMYNNNTWTLLTGGVNQPANAYMLSKAGATANSITIYDGSDNLWFYNGSAWTKIGDGTTPPNPYASTMGGTFYGVSTNTSVIFTSGPASGPASNSQLWIYDGSNWSNVSGSSVVGSPPDVGTIFGTPSNNNLVIRDNHAATNNNLDNYSIWTFAGNTWTNLTTGDGVSTPQYGWMVYGTNATPSQFFMSDLQNSSTANLWEWTGSTWSKKTGGSGAPTSVGFVGGNPMPSSFVMIDGSQQLWTNVNGGWANITGHVDEPSDVDMIYGLVNPDSIVATHYVDKLTGSELWIGKR